MPPALLLTGTLRLVGRITGAVLDWSASLAFNPTTWLGVGLGGLAVALLLTSRVLDSRRPGEPVGRREAAPVQRGRDDDLAEIEDILRRRGIS